MSSAVNGRGNIVTEEVTEPLSAIGHPRLELPGQIARFGSLAGRELSARAFAARQASGAVDPQHNGGAQDCEPLSAAERLEMRALAAAITGIDRPAALSGTGDAGQSASPEVLHRPARLWRPAAPAGPRRGPARHRRIADVHPR